jgi:hypothetical protein
MEDHGRAPAGDILGKGQIQPSDGKACIIAGEKDRAKHLSPLRQGYDDHGSDPDPLEQLPALRVGRNRSIVVGQSPGDNADVFVNDPGREILSGHLGHEIRRQLGAKGADVRLNTAASTP